MTALRPVFAALALIVAATPAWSQSAQGLAAREVTAAEEAFLAEHYSAAVDEQIEEVIVRLGPLSSMLHEVFPPALHAEIDATVAAYFEGQRTDLRGWMMRALAESMTLEEMGGLGLNTIRSLEISQSVTSQMEAHGQRMAIGALRRVCSVVQDRAVQECRTILERADQFEAQLGG